MQVPLEWRTQRGLWGIITGEVTVDAVIDRGWAHAINDAHRHKFGRNVDEIVADHHRYSQLVDAMRVVPVPVLLEEIVNIE